MTGGVATSGLLAFNGGTLKSSNAGGLSLGNAMVQSGGAILDSNGNQITVDQTLSHNSNGGLTVQGAGSVVVAASQTYTGATNIINGGTLKLQQGGGGIGSNLIALYQFNSSATADISGGLKAGVFNGQTFNGTAYGAVSVVPGAPNNGETASLNLNGGYIDLPTTLSAVNPFRGSGTINGQPGGSYTITCWFESTATNNPVILSSAQDNTSTNHSMAFFIDNGAGGQRRLADRQLSMLVQRHAGVSNVERRQLALWRGDIPSIRRTPSPSSAMAPPARTRSTRPSPTPKTTRSASAAH